MHMKKLTQSEVQSEIIETLADQFEELVKNDPETLVKRLNNAIQKSDSGSVSLSYSFKVSIEDMKLNLKNPKLKFTVSEVFEGEGYHINLDDTPELPLNDK